MVASYGVEGRTGRLGRGAEERSRMSAVELAVSVLPIVITAAGGAAGLMRRSRMQRLRLREQDWCHLVRHLPPESVLIDLGKRGMVIEIGGRGVDSRCRLSETAR